MSKKSAPVFKILIDLDEYLKLMTLKERIKKQEEELSKHYQHKSLLIPPSSESDIPENNPETTAEHKSGAGLENELVFNLKNRIENLEKQLQTTSSLNQIGSGAGDLITQLPDPIGVNNAFQEHERLEQFRPVSSVTIEKSRMNDVFDEKRLLSHIPASLLTRATKLLEELDKHPTEFSWDSAGVVYLDQKSLPESDIYFLFPRLFRKIANPDKILHLHEIASKIATMGFGSLINRRLTSGLIRTKPIPNHEELRHKIATTSNNWWFIGDDQ